MSCYAMPVSGILSLAFRFGITDVRFVVTRITLELIVACISVVTLIGCILVPKLTAVYTANSSVRACLLALFLSVSVCSMCLFFVLYW